MVIVNRAAGEGCAQSIVVAGADHDVMRHIGQRARHFGEHRNQRAVDDDDPIVGVIDHEGELLGKQPDVEGMHHRPHGRDGQVALQVLLVIPGEGANPLVAADAERAQCVGQLCRPPAYIGKGGHPGGELPGGRVVGVEGGDTGIGVDRDAPGEDGSNGESKVLHGAEHGWEIMCHGARTLHGPWTCSHTHCPRPQHDRWSAHRAERPHAALGN